VTGGARGIGRATARELAKHGAHVVVVARSADELAETCRIVQAEGGRATALVADITQASWLAELDRVAPRVDVLVNNAASFAPYAPLEKVEWTDLEQVFATTLLAATRLSRHVVGGMKERGFGRLIHVG